MKVALATGLKIVILDSKVFSTSSKMPSGHLMRITVVGLFDVFEVGNFNVAEAEKAKAKEKEADADSAPFAKAKEAKEKVKARGEVFME